MCTGKVSLDRAAFLHGKDRRMCMGFIINPILFQKGKKCLSGFMKRRHGGLYGPYLFLLGIAQFLKEICMLQR